jgi:hypothetical protein
VPLLNASTNIFSASVAASGTNLIQTNTSNNATSFSSIRAKADNTNEMIIGIQSSAAASAFWTGGPTSQSAFLGSSAALPISLATNGIERIRVDGSGASINLKATAIQGNGVDMTPSTGSGSFTIASGCSTTPSFGYRYTKIGNIVSLVVNGVTCTSTTNALTFTGVPAAILPATGAFQCGVNVVDNGVVVQGAISMSLTNPWSFVRPNSTLFTSSGTKGMPDAQVCTYTVQ